MNLVEGTQGVKIALDSIWANKFRSFMTILGVLIGVASVIAMVAIIKGVDESVKGSIEKLGSNVLFVSKFPPDTDHSNLSDEERRHKPITYEDAEVIRQQCPSVDGISPEDYYQRPEGNIAKYRDQTVERPSLFGTLPDYEKVNNTYAVKGRFFTDTESFHAARACVLGHDIAEGLFPDRDPIGEVITINSTRFTVVGVMEELDLVFDDSPNNFIAIPLNTFLKMYPWEKELWLAVSAKSPELMDQAQEEIVNALRLHRGVPYDKENDFAIFTQENLKELYEDLTGTIVAVMVVISAIGLMVGGVGVLNIMLVSVTERTREIGVRKAIGARKSNILLQFLVEAVTLSCSGGTIGILVGLGISAIVSAATGLPFAVPIMGIILGFSVAVGVGLVSGVYPAYRAAKVDPVVSLRYE
ncbi:MAG: ABC transporter permease [Candidatus Zixiibacteriota bacterium]